MPGSKERDQLSWFLRNMLHLNKSVFLKVAVEAETENTAAVSDHTVSGERFSFTALSATPSTAYCLTNRRMPFVKLTKRTRAPGAQHKHSMPYLPHTTSQ